jgi:P4 family phage/plasmid primase-like protien
MDGARLAWASETEKGRAWAENRIKSLTGGDKITARFMRQNSFEFTPQMKLTIVGNNAPNLTTVDEAMKRRFIILPFDHPPKSKDTDLPAKLKAEWSGILSWMIEGCLDWQANGLIRPEVARRATEAYFAEQDIFAQWIEDCCELGDFADTTANLWESWSSYAFENGEHPGNKKRSFPETLSQRGFEPVKDTMGIRGRGWRGLRVAEGDMCDDFEIL